MSLHNQYCSTQCRIYYDINCMRILCHNLVHHSIAKVPTHVVLRSFFPCSMPLGTAYKSSWVSRKNQVSSFSSWPATCRANTSRAWIVCLLAIMATYFMLVFALVCVAPAALSEAGCTGNPCRGLDRSQPALSCLDISRSSPDSPLCSVLDQARRHSFCIPSFLWHGDRRWWIRHARFHVCQGRSDVQQIRLVSTSPACCPQSHFCSLPAFVSVYRAGCQQLASSSVHPRSSPRVPCNRCYGKAEPNLGHRTRRSSVGRVQELGQRPVQGCRPKRSAERRQAPRARVSDFRRPSWVREIARLASLAPSRGQLQLRRQTPRAPSWTEASASVFFGSVSTIIYHQMSWLCFQLLLFFTEVLEDSLWKTPAQSRCVSFVFCFLQIVQSKAISFNPPLIFPIFDIFSHTFLDFFFGCAGHMWVSWTCVTPHFLQSFHRSTTKQLRFLLMSSSSTSCAGR